MTRRRRGVRRSVDWRGSSSRVKSACRRAQSPAIVVNVHSVDGKVATTQVYDLKAAQAIVREALRASGGDVLKFGLTVYDRDDAAPISLASSTLFPITHKRPRRLGRTLAST